MGEVLSFSLKIQPWSLAKEEEELDAAHTQMFVYYK